VVHSENRLYLVFDYLDQDLKKYMDSVDPAGMPPDLVKVSPRPKTHRELADALASRGGAAIARRRVTCTKCSLASTSAIPAASCTAT
jgi:hypothetical protein